MPTGRPSDLPSIYGLYDASGALRYIGKANNPKARLASHMRDARVRDTPVYRWIRKNGKPKMRVLAADCEDWKADERRLIAEARQRGERLLNVAEGGDQPECPPAILSRNGHDLVARLRADPELALQRNRNRDLMRAIKEGFLDNRRRALLRAAARAYPKQMGVFTSIPDRDEDQNGKAWVKSGVSLVQVG